MKSVRLVAHGSLWAALFAYSGSALAQHAGHTGHSGHAASAASAATPSAALGDMAEGEVRRVDKAGGKITLRHGEIKNLDMPPMTMVFQVADPSLLDKVRAGDKVRFKAVQAEGSYRVIGLELAR